MAGRAWNSGPETPFTSVPRGICLNTLPHPVSLDFLILLAALALQSADLHSHTDISTYSQRQSFSPGLDVLIHKMGSMAVPAS